MRSPVLADNLLYDMDSTTSPSSSSDSDGAPENRSRQLPVGQIQETPAQNSEFVVARRIQKSAPAKTSSSSVMTTEWRSKSRPSSPLQEMTMNRTPDAVSSFKPRHLLPPCGDVRRSRRQAQNRSNVVTQKRWM